MRAHVLLLGQSPGPPSALICGDNANLGKRGSPRARVGGLRPSSAPHPIPGPGEKFSNCFQNLPVGPGGGCEGGCLGRLYYFQIPELCRRGVSKPPGVVCQGLQLNFSLTEQNFCPKLPFCLGQKM